MLIEGFYNATSNLQISDTIRVYLRNSISPYNAVDSAAALLSDSSKATITFTNAQTGNYFLQIKHLNDLETGSANPVTKAEAGTIQYDYTSATSQSFGNNMKQVDSSPVRFAFFSGDFNNDKSVGLSDIVEVFNDASDFVTGYSVTDLKSDGFVDLNDITIAFNNSNLFVIVINP